MPKPNTTEYAGKGATKQGRAQADEVYLPFRKADWLAFALTLSTVWLVYFLTLAPEVTLEDSGELVTGAYYAGVPHPPGYPVWTLYSWLWTVLVPVGNIAWRVALGQATAGAVSCGLIALLVSGGSYFLLNGSTLGNSLPKKVETLTAVTCGFTAGLLMGLDNFMWRESVAVNRIAVSSVPWLLLVLLNLMRWNQAPAKRRYLYWALFLFGLCFTAHQSLIVASLGIEALLIARQPALGRDVLLGNSLIYLVYNLAWWITGHHLFHNIGAKPGLFFLFNAIGVGSVLGCLGLAIRTGGLGKEWRVVLVMGLLWLIGASFYFYLPLACMSNPPMQWDYPRTVDGFLAALSRGQYEQPNPTNLVAEPGRFVGQLGMLLAGLGASFTWVGVFIAVVPFLAFRRLEKPQRSWLLGLFAIYFCLGVVLMMLLNPTPDRASAELVKVFFNSSHTIVACLIGYGLALSAAAFATNYRRSRGWGIWAGVFAMVLAVIGLFDATARHYFGPGGHISLFELPGLIAQAFHWDQYGLPVYSGLWLVVLSTGFCLALCAARQRAPLTLILSLFVLLPLYSGLANWFPCNQRGHMFGYWFGHDMFAPPFKDSDGSPLFPEMPKSAVLFGGTDPGRFCPTYMIFCESFLPHRLQPKEDQAFDRRDVYIITQNALADPPYQNYIRAHYNRSEQTDPPFFGELARRILGDNEYQTNLCSRAVAPLDTFFAGMGEQIEWRRRTSTSWFNEADFLNVKSLAARLSESSGRDPLSKFLFSCLSPRTRELIQRDGERSGRERNLAHDFNEVLRREDLPGGLATDPKFSTDTVTPMKPSLPGFERVRLNRRRLEEAYPEEIRRSPGGLYPDLEIHLPSATESSLCFDLYLQDVKRRMATNELRTGEEVTVVGDRMQVTGQGAVMAINGLIAKQIFERNPAHEFYVEESMPIEWMYPHLSPAGVIMKINRQPLASIPSDVLRRDHEFWSQYSRRLTGEIVRNDTSVRELAAWIEKTYLNRNFQGFTGDKGFIFDLDAQRAFSKFRSAIAGVYSWRLSPGCPAPCRPKSPEEFQQVLREADFSYRQAFAFCPWSPEAAFHYINLLLQTNRLEDALLVAETYLKLDPFSAQGHGVLQYLRSVSTKTTSR